MIFLLLLMSDFTFHATEGMWIDYARTGRISENRYLVHQYYGKKGNYGDGARVMILDQDGDLLYEMPEAENAWLIRNGVLKNEDLYIFQTRDERTWFLWHPDHGAKPLEGDLNFGRRGSHGMSLSEQGNLYFLNLHPDSTEIEEIIFSDVPIATLFEDRLRLSHRSHTIEGNNVETVLTGIGIYVYFPWKSLRHETITFFYFPFDVPGGGNLEPHYLNTQFTYIKPLGDWFNLYHHNFGTIIHDGEKVLLTYPNKVQNAKKTKDKDPAKDFFNLLLSAFGKGVVKQTGDTLQFLYDGKLHQYNATTATFNIYRLPGGWSSVKGWRHVDTNPMIKVNHQRLKIQQLPHYQSKSLVPEQSIKIDERFFQLDRELRSEREHGPLEK